MNSHNITSASRICFASKLQLAAVGFFLLTTQISCATVGKNLGIFRRSFERAVQTIVSNPNQPLIRQGSGQSPIAAGLRNDKISSSNTQADLPANNSYSNSLSGSNCNQRLTEGS